MGEYLYSPTPLKKADLIVALGGSRWRQREAVALIKRELAEYIAFVGGDVHESDADCLGLLRRQIIIVETPAYTTMEEALAVSRVVEERGFKSVIIITSWYHLRRAGLIFSKALDGKGVELMLHPSNHEPFDSKTWWHSYIGRKLIIMEYIGLGSFWVGYWL